MAKNQSNFPKIKGITSQMDTAALLAARLPQSRQAPPNRLTRAEVDILLLSANPSLSVKDLAQKLNITEGTLKCHFNNIYSKLEVNTRSNARTIALQRFVNLYPVYAPVVLKAFLGEGSKVRLEQAS